MSEPFNTLSENTIENTISLEEETDEITNNIINDTEIFDEIDQPKKKLQKQDGVESDILMKLDSIDSLKTINPEPEIERALANTDKSSPPTPEPTMQDMAIK